MAINLDNIFQGILNQHKVDIVIKYRTITGKDAYGQPIYTITSEETVKGFSQLIKSEDEMKEMGLSINRELMYFWIEMSILDVNDIVYYDGYDWALMHPPIITLMQVELIVRRLI